MTINPDHKYLIADMNGYSRASATTRPAAIKRARKLAAETGLDMSVCYSCRSWIGAQHYIVNVRCKDAGKLKKRHYALNGQAFIGESHV